MGIAFRVGAPARVDAWNRFQLWRLARRDALVPAYIQRAGREEPLDRATRPGAAGAHIVWLGSR
jgi:hypothetical protein